MSSKKEDILSPDGLKYEQVYLNAYGSAKEARGCIGREVEFYNELWYYQGIKGRTPD